MTTRFAFGCRHNVMWTRANCFVFPPKDRKERMVRRRKVCVYQVVNRNPVYTDSVVYLILRYSSRDMKLQLVTAFRVNVPFSVSPL